MHIHVFRLLQNIILHDIFGECMIILLDFFFKVLGCLIASLCNSNFINVCHFEHEYSVECK